MSGSTRRGLLGGGAALAVAPLVPAMSAHPDAELIALCAKLDALERKYLATDFDLMPGTPEDDAAEAERARISEAQQPLVDAICARPPQTTAGAVAVAHSLALWDGDLFRQGGPDGCTNERLVAVLVRGLVPLHSDYDCLAIDLKPLAQVGMADCNWSKSLCKGTSGEGEHMSGSTRQPRASDWTEAEEAQLRAMMPDHRMVDIARAMGRTWAATHKKCERMGLLGQHAGARSKEPPAPNAPPPDAPGPRDDPSPLPPFHPISLAALAKVGPVIEPPRKSS